ncbi:MAG: molybdopterin-dependent oxidoreductase [Bacteroidales bacterium]|nr:molybdopterin-dependent oxidoreductase [Bacteroidales bacterium]
MIQSRRKFIKVSAIGVGGAVALGSSWKMVEAAINTNNAEEILSADGRKLKRYPTYCEVCFWKCAGWVYLDENGDVEKIYGNDQDTHCNGRLCPRGTGGVGMYNDPDRLKTPLIRVAKEGGDQFRAASWEEALDLIASKMKNIKATYGAPSIALLKHGSPGKHFEHLLKAYGSDTIGEPAYAQCRGAREEAWAATFGTWVGSPEPTDIRDTKCLVLIGSHIGENMHNSQVQEMSQAIDKGACIITVDPRMSTAATKSKYWLPIKPATDIALLLAWIHVIVYEKLYDQAYIEKNTHGFDELKKHVQSFTPEWAYGITTIKPDVIRKTAHEMANAAPAVIVHPGRHVAWYGDDTQRGRAIAILNGILGSWGKRGGFYLKEKIKVPKFPHPPYQHADWTWKDLAKDYPMAKMGLTQEIIKASIPSEHTEHQVKAWLVAGTNLPKTIPNKQILQEAISAVEFIVVVDTMPMDIVGYADVVLPECTYLERYDGIRSATNRTPSIALRMPARKPKYESKPAWWIAKQLGERLGLQDFFNYEDYSEVIDWQLKEMGSSLEEMQHLGVKNFPRTSGSPYYAEGEEIKLKTNTGKIELYSTELAALGFDPMPKFTPHPEPEAGYYRLIYGRAPMHTFSRTSNNANLFDLMDTNSLWMNPQVAQQWGFKKGQEIYLKNQDGVVSEFPIKIRLTERMRWDSIYMVHGFGHTNDKLRLAYGHGISDTDMINRVSIDPIMGGTGMRGNFVTFLSNKPKEVLA